MRIEEKEGALVITDFDEVEAYKIACKIEKDGLEFYKGLKDAVKSKETGKAIELLTGEEQKHLAFFERAIFTIREHSEDLSEDNDLLESMDYGIFSPYKNTKELKKAIKNREDALRLGIIIEDNSIRFYSELIGRIKSETAIKGLAVIIKEESSHKQLLENILRELKIRQ
ncbi:MAG: ferritin family protein [Candidatus Omnitrophica bacterium]|nr:ferritin family protein [Candidatus Omnitrophota bacterium]